MARKIFGTYHNQSSSNSWNSKF